MTNRPTAEEAAFSNSDKPLSSDELARDRAVSGQDADPLPDDADARPTSLPASEAAVAGGDGADTADSDMDAAKPLTDLPPG